MRAVVCAVAALALGTASGGEAQTSPAASRTLSGIAIAEMVWIAGEVTRAAPPDKSVWRRVNAGDSLRTGDTLRTAEDALVRVEFPWMTVTLGPSAMLTVPSSAVLSTVLDSGRAEFSGPGREIVKIQVGDAEVRGGGRVVLRRSVGRTSVTALEGVFRVRALGRTVEVKALQATLVADGRPPQPASGLPPTPTGLSPGAEVGYVRSGQPIELSWSAASVAHHLELLTFDGSWVLLARDVGPPPLRLALPWLGTYRWRVSARDAYNIESAPSVAGLLCSVER